MVDAQESIKDVSETISKGCNETTDSMLGVKRRETKTRISKES